MVESPVGHLNSLPFISQTGAKSPGKEEVFIKNAKKKKKREILISPFLGVQFKV